MDMKQLKDIGVNFPVMPQFEVSQNWLGDMFQQGQQLVNHLLKQMSFNVPSSPLEAMPPVPSMIQNMISKPMTIFDPEVMTDALTKAQTHLGQQLEEHPQKFMEIQQNFIFRMQELMNYTHRRVLGENVDDDPIIEPLKNDKRFKDPAWSEDPYFDFLKQAYLLQAELLKSTVQNLDGLDPKTHHKVDFYTRHFLDAMAPSNYPMTNPVVLKEAVSSNGETLVKGMLNFLTDMTEGQGQIRMTDMTAFELGKNIATTPGHVVFENDLFQLIQYTPTTEKVVKTPLLIVPPWVNKYYIFDLRPENSFVKWAVEKGHTVFIMSWVNPDETHATRSFSDYILEGPLQAIKAIQHLTGEDTLNAMGYCAGGIALTTLLAYLAGKKLNYIKSATIIASPIDTSESGELLVYVCDKQLRKLESHLYERGYLGGDAMNASFNLLRANDLIWSFYINNYLLGRDPAPFDMLYWNGDSTRMPARMHAEYLRNIFLENRLAKNGTEGIKFNGVEIDLQQIKTPLYVFGTVDDHIAPWRSVYGLVRLASGQKEFVLGGSGHVAGVFNPPHREKYGYWAHGNASHDASHWYDGAKYHTGSWWTHWENWIDQHTGPLVKSRTPKAKDILEDAPGRYVKVREH